MPHSYIHYNIRLVVAIYPCEWTATHHCIITIKTRNTTQFWKSKAFLRYYFPWLSVTLRMGYCVESWLRKILHQVQRFEACKIQFYLWKKWKLSTDRCRIFEKVTLQWLIRDDINRWFAAVISYVKSGPPGLNPEHLYLCDQTKKSAHSGGRTLKAGVISNITEIKGTQSCQSIFTREVNRSSVVLSF